MASTRGVIVANVTTSSQGLRSEIEGWTYEDSRLYVHDKPIGFTPGASPRLHHQTVLEMLADGFRLIAPPEEEVIDAIGTTTTYYSWWLQKEV